MKSESEEPRKVRKLGVTGALIMAFMLVFRDREAISRPKIVWVDTTKGAAP
jgi:hypothetical protein